MSSLARAINRQAALILILTLIALLAAVQFTAAAPRSPDRLASTSAAASIVISPTVTGGFGSPGGAASFQLRINNPNGTADTFDLFPSSPWPMTFYRLDGVTPLTDTDGDGTIDTDVVIANWYAFIVVKLAVPAGATIGQYSTGTLTVRSSAAPAQSSVATFTAAVPAPFGQSYAPNDQPQLSVNRLYLQTIQPTAASYGYNPAVAITPDGNLVQVWEQGRTNSLGKKIYELYLAVVDGQGNLIRSATALTNLDSAIDNTHDNQPALAVAPNGRIGVTWYRTRADTAGNFNYNLFTLILDANGGVVLPPTNLTNNTQWGTALTPNVPQFFEPVIAATPDNRFMLMWRRQLYTGFSTRNTLWYTVRDTGGGAIKPVAQFGADTCSYHPQLTALFDGSVFLVQETCAKVAYARLNSSGGLLVNPTVLTNYTGNDGPVAAQLANGNLLLAWQHNTGLRYALQYAVLNAALGIVKAPTDLPSISPVGDDDVSATRAADRAVLTWTDVFTDHPNLYYTLLDNTGGLITPPIIIATDLSQQLAVATNGQGNTYLAVDTTSPNNPISLSSPDHTLNQWSKDNRIDVIWSGASDNHSIGGYSIGWDTNPIGLPDAQRDLPASAISTTSPALANGLWYFHIRTVDVDGNWTTTAAHLGPFKIDTILPQSAAQSPLYAVGPFTITWSGSDVGSGLTGYNVFVRDQAIGTWALWLSNTSGTSGVYSGTIGHTYYFRSEARDAAGNVETDLPADGDAHTTVAAFQIDGQVYNNRHAPIFNARIEAQPAALTTTHTDPRGAYTLYFINSAVYTLTASRADFGLLPPHHNLILTRTQIGPDLVLPPLNDAVINGGWETGDFTGWIVDPAITATVEFTAAHTGWYGLHLAAPLTGTGFLPVLTQTLTITGAQPTLSLMYRVTDGSGEPFVITLLTDTGVLTHSLVVTPGDWTHDWIDLSSFVNEAVTFTLGFQNPSAAQQIDLDEISSGATQIGVYPVYLPVVRR